MSLATPPPLETVNTVDYCSVVRFTWRIENFQRFNTKKLYSESFCVEGYKWRVLMFPKGNNVDHLSIYLDVADLATLPRQWSRYARFSLAVINHIHKEHTVRKGTQHRFNGRENDWGFTSLMPLSELYDPCRGFLVNDTIVVEADVAVNCSQDSKKGTGSVGLKNRKAEQEGREEESQPPSQDNNSKDVADITGTTGSSPPQQACRPNSGTQTTSVNARHQGSGKATPVSDTCNIPQAGGHASSGQASDNASEHNIVLFNNAAPPGKVTFLSYWVSPEASLVLKKIHSRYKDTFPKFSMTSVLLQTVLLESFASFIESMSTTKIYETNEEALRVTAVSIKDFEHVGLDLSWLKQRLDEAKMVNEHSELLTSIVSYESSIEETRAKLRELKEGLAKAKAEAEVSLRDLPKSLGLNDSFLKGLVSFSKS